MTDITLETRVRRRPSREKSARDDAARRDVTSSMLATSLRIFSSVRSASSAPPVTPPSPAGY